MTAVPTTAVPAIELNDGRAIPFELEPADLSEIDPRDRDEAGRRGASPDTFAYVP